MIGKLLYTPVDQLVEIVRQQQPCSINYLQNQLNTSAEIVERWLTVLEEYEVIHVRYKGFEGYVSLTKKEKEKQTKKKENEVDVEKLKDQFIQRCKEQNLSYEQIKELWPEFIKEYENEIQELFTKKARTMGYDPKRIDTAWKRFKKELMVI